MKRRACVAYWLNRLKAKHPLQFENLDINAVELYYDLGNVTLIKDILVANQNKFKLIIFEILNGRYNKDLYRVEDDCVTAMKLKNAEHKQNSRIYCKEVPGSKFEKKKIIMAKGLLHKTSQKNDKTNKPIIEAVKKYEYEYFKKLEDAKK